MESAPADPLAASVEVHRSGRDRKPLQEQLAIGLEALAASPRLLLAASVTVNALLLPYQGLYHDAILYGLQTLNRVDAGHFANDLYLRFGSQDRFSVFSLMAAVWVRAFGLPVGFFVLYLITNTLFLWAVQRLLFAVVPSRRLATLGTLAVAGLALPFGGFGLFHANEPFLTPRILANALVLFALERLLFGRWLVCGALLAGALVVHPLMAFAGILVAVGWVLLHWLTPRGFTGLLIGGAIAAAVPLVYFPLGARLFGVIDDDWLAAARAVNFYNFPAEWNESDWLRIGFATVMVLLARAYLPKEAPAARRLLALVVGVAWLGAAGAVVVYQLPYAFLMQGQPYRALWVMQLLEVPLGIFVVGHWWQMEASWGRWLAVVWVASWLVPLTRPLLALMLLGFIVTVVIYRLRGPVTASGAWAFQCFVLSVAGVVCLAWAVSRALTAKGWAQNGYLHLVEIPEAVSQLLLVLRPLPQLAVLALILWACSWPFVSRQAMALAAVGLAAAVAFFAVSEFIVGTSGPTDPPIALIREYLATHPNGQETPTVYAPAVRSIRPLWFDLGVNSYFHRFQMHGNLFSRGNALEGMRRARMVQRFEIERYHEVYGELGGGDRQRVERLLDISWEGKPPTEENFRRLVADPEVDYLLLRQRFDDLAVATDGQWFLYDCRRSRSANLPAVACKTPNR